MPFLTYEKQYQISTGNLGIKISYWNQSADAVLSCDLIKDIELNYGYEDQDDLLVFYPNTVKLIFDDVDKKNYYLLKSSIENPPVKVHSNYNNLPLEDLYSGGIEIYLNGIIKFKGYIDPLTLTYHDSSRTLEFEGVCLTSRLKDEPFGRYTCYLDTSGWAMPENAYVECTRILWSIYFNVLWGIFNPNKWYEPLVSWNQSFHHISELSNNVFGLFIDHDWIFKGFDNEITPKYVYANWQDLQDFVYTEFNFDSMGYFSAMKYQQDAIKQLALEFGATIGTEDFGQVYFIKRFGRDKNNSIDLQNSLIKFDVFEHLDWMKGAVIKNHWNGDRQYEYGLVERIENGELKYPDKVVSYDTYIGSYFDSHSRGTCISVFNPQNQHMYPVFNGIRDPQIGGTETETLIYQLLGRWVASSRSKVKQRVECELYGIDYRMAYLYKLKYDNENYIYFRPMTITKNLMKNSTKLTGIEI